MDKKFVLLMIVFFLVFGVFITSTLLNKQIANITRASTETYPSSQTSLIFAWPLDVSLAERKTSEVNIVVRNGNNNNLGNQTVKLETDFGTLDQSEKITDKSGKVNFILTSNVEGTANLSATINNTIPLSQKISVKFK
jgi:hypothetical protein